MRDVCCRGDVKNDIAHPELFARIRGKQINDFIGVLHMAFPIGLDSFTLRFP